MGSREKKLLRMKGGLEKMFRLALIRKLYLKTDPCSKKRIFLTVLPKISV
jgi:hypothetical protein